MKNKSYNWFLLWASPVTPMIQNEYGIQYVSKGYKVRPRAGVEYLNTTQPRHDFITKVIFTIAEILNSATITGYRAFKDYHS